MLLNNKNHEYFKSVYLFSFFISLVIITGCGGGVTENGDNRINGTVAENTSYLNATSLPLPTCVYPKTTTAPLPFTIPEIPQSPIIISNGNTYHIDKDHPDAANLGNDGSAEQPWKDLQFAFDKLNAGDKLIIHASLSGYTGWYEMRNAGVENNWIHIEGVDGSNGEKVILNNSLSFNGSAAYIYVTNIDIQGGGWTKLGLKANVNHLVIDKMEIDCQSKDDNYSGIFINEGVNNVWFSNINIHHCGYVKENPTDPSGVYMMPPSSDNSLIDYIIFINVHVRDNKGDGIGGSEVGAVFFDGCSSSNNTGDGYDIGAKTRSVFKNSVSSENGGDQGNGFKIWSKEAWLVNCLTFNNDYPGVVNKPKVKDSEIYILNSTFIGDNQFKYGGEIRIVNLFPDDMPDVSSNKVFLYNNIFHTFNTVAVFFEDISNQMLAGENNNSYFSAEYGVAMEFRDNKVGDRSYSIIEMGDGTWHSAEGFGEKNIGMILDNEDCQLH